MASKKAILVTKANRESLESQYDLEEDMLEGFEGLYLIADFGSSTAVHHGWVNKIHLDMHYTIGRELQNDYFEIVRR